MKTAIAVDLIEIVYIMELLWGTVAVFSWQLSPFTTRHGWRCHLIICNRLSIWPQFGALQSHNHSVPSTVPIIGWRLQETPIVPIFEFKTSTFYTNPLKCAFLHATISQMKQDSFLGIFRSLRNYEMDDNGDLVVSAKWEIPADEEITISSLGFKRRRSIMVHPYCHRGSWCGYWRTVADRYFFQSVVSIRQSFLKKKNLNIDKNDNSAYSIVKVYGSLIMSNIMHSFRALFQRSWSQFAAGQRLWSQIQPRTLGLVWLCGSTLSGALLVPADLHAGAEAIDAEAVVVLPKYVPLKSMKCIRRM